MSNVIALPTGADARLTGDPRPRAVICVNGGAGRDVEGDWSASLEWLVRKLAPRFPDLGFAEVRYRIKSWRQLESCIEDGAATLDLAVARGARECTLLGFSMGGAVAIALAGHPAVSAVIGLAPWVPDRLDVSTLDGKHVAVMHGRLDAWIPGIPGVSPRHTLRGIERIRARGTEVSHTLISGAVHGIAVHGPFGGLAPLPRAGRWVDLVADELSPFQAGSGWGPTAGDAPAARPSAASRPTRGPDAPGHGT